MAVYGVECCPYLGLKSDVSSYRTYPTADAACLALPRPYCPSDGKQHLLCHSRRHTQCPRFAQAGPSTAARRRLPFQKQPYAALVSFVLVALVLFAFGLHVVHLGDYSLWWDETLSYHRASGGLLYALSNRITLASVVTIDQHPPLYFVVLSGLLALAGKSEFVMRFPSVAFTVLAVPLIFVTGSRLAGRAVGITAAALGATSPFLLWAAWEARPYALLALLSVLSIYLLLRVMDDDRQSRWIVAWIISLAAMLATHYISAILIGCEVVLAAGFAVAGRTQQRRVLVGGIFALGALAVPTGIYAFQRFETMSETAGVMPALTFVQDLPQTLSLGEAGRLLPPTLLMAVLGAILACGIVSLASRSRLRTAIVMAFVLAVPFLGLYVVMGSAHLLYNSRYGAFLAPGYYLLLALGIARLLKLRRMVGVTALLCVAGIGVASMAYVQASGPNTQQDLRAASAHIVQESRPDDAILLVTTKVASALQYYEIGPLDQYLSKTIRGAAPSDVESQLASIASRHPRMWVVTDFWDHRKDADLLSMLDASYSRLEKTTFSKPGYAQDIFLYQTSPRVIDKLPAGATPVDSRLGDEVRLIGYKLQPSASKPGRIHLTLFWQALATPQKLRAFGELTDNQGRIWGSFDGEPYGGFFPTTTWKPGEVIVDEREMDPDSGAPPGRYSLSVGLRRSESNQALPAVQPGRLPRESVPLGEVELQGFDQAATRELPAGVTRLDANVGPLVLLAAKSPIADLHPGESMPLRLYWRLSSSAQPLDRINVRLALLSPNGEVITSTVQPLVENLPGSQSVEGALLASDHTVRIPRNATSEPYQVAILVGSSDGETLRFGPSWWVFDTDRAIVATVRVHGFDRQSNISSTSLPIQKDVGNVAQLAAFAPGADWRARIDAAGALTVDREGARPANLDVTLYWRVRSATDQNLTAFVQLLDANGRLVVQHDGIPQLGKRPTSGWLPLEVITDLHPIVGLETLRPGRYTLIAGLYDTTTGQRLPTSSGDYVVLSTVVLD